MFDQDCHWGFKVEADKDNDNPLLVVNNTVVLCKNIQCPNLYCRFSHFSGGQIPDEECGYYTKNYRSEK